TLAEVGMLWGPAQFVVQRRRVDGVSQVVADAVGDVVEIVGVATHHLQQRAQHTQVVALTFGADEVGPADLPFFEDPPHRVVVVVDVDPVADVGAAAVQLGPPAGEHIGDLAWDELFDVLIRPVVVGAVGDCRLHAVRTHPGPDQHVAGGFGGRVRARWVVGRRFREPYWVVELQVAVDLVGGDVVQPHAVSSYRLQDGERPDHVGAQGQLRVVQRVVHVGFGGEMYYRVALGDQPRNQLAVRDVALHQPDGIGDLGQRLTPSGIGQGVEHRHRIFG